MAVLGWRWVVSQSIEAVMGFGYGLRVRLIESHTEPVSLLSYGGMRHDDSQRCIVASSYKIT